jgi:tRNA A-37 threonylcarbamoyl transferase component Bud32
MLGERYLLEEPIATGGMATVWRAHDELLARTVAVKILHDHLAADEAFRERFRREAIAAAKLSHPAVVSVFDTGSDGDRVYLVMEYIDGPTLREVVNDLGVLEAGQAAAIGEQLARALAAAHERGLVHRDVKPANILLCPDGSPKIADFGIAKADEGTDDLTKPGMVLGTAAYVAPEQVRGGAIDGQADQYALGCVLYEALTGRQPFRADSPVATAALRLDHDPLPMRSLRAGIPRGLDEVVLRAMAREPAGRYPSAGHLADALAPFADPDLAGRLLQRPDETRTAAWPAATNDTATLAGAPPSSSLPYAGSTGDDSFLRSEGRWIGSVLGLLAVVGVLIGLGLATGVLEPGDGFPIRIARDATGPGDGLVAPIAIDAFDPEGDGSENDAELPAILDGDNATSWRTDLYRGSPRFGNLKTGVGFWVDLGASRTLHSVALRTTTPGISYEVRVADSPAPRVDGWRPAGAVASASALQEVRFAEPVTTRYVLVWITGLQPQRGRFAAGFSAMAVRGQAP